MEDLNHSSMDFTWKSICIDFLLCKFGQQPLYSGRMGAAMNIVLQATCVICLVFLAFFYYMLRSRSPRKSKNAILSAKNPDYFPSMEKGRRGFAPYGGFYAWVPPTYNMPENALHYPDVMSRIYNPGYQTAREPDVYYDADENPEEENPDAENWVIRIRKGSMVKVLKTKFWHFPFLEIDENLPERNPAIRIIYNFTVENALRVLYKMVGCTNYV